MSRERRGFGFPCPICWRPSGWLSLKASVPHSSLRLLAPKTRGKPFASLPPRPPAVRALGRCTMSQSPFQLKTIRGIFSFGSSQQSQEKAGSQDRGRSSPQPIRCAGPDGVGSGRGAQRKKRSLNLALSQVTLGSPVEGLAASSSLRQASVEDLADANALDSLKTAGTGTQQNSMCISQSQDFFCTPDFITPNDAHVKLPAPGTHAGVGGALGLGNQSNPPTRDFTPLACKRPRSVFDVLMCPENRRSQLQAYTQELNAYKPPGTRVRSGGLKAMKSVPKSPLCVKNPFRREIPNVPGKLCLETRTDGLLFSRLGLTIAIFPLPLPCSPSYIRAQATSIRRTC